MPQKLEVESWFLFSAQRQMVLYICTKFLENILKESDGWMDDLRFYVLLNNISVISGR